MPSFSTDQKESSSTSTFLRSDGPLSLLPIQRVLLKEELQSEASGSNVEQVAIEIGMSIDENAMRGAVQHVVQTHEALCVKFDWSQPESPTQQVEPDLVPSFRTVEADSDSMVEQLLTEELERGFDLNQPSQMRMVLLRHDTRSTLVCTAHRLVIDKPSLENVLQQILESYEAILAGHQPAELKTTSLESLVRWEQQLDHAEGTKAIQRLLDGVDSTPLPLPNEQGELSGEFSVVRQELSEAHCSQARQYVLEEEVHEDTLVQLAWGILLGRYGAGRDVVFGGNWSARDGDYNDLDDLNNVVAPCRAKLPVRVQLDPAQTARDTLQGFHAWRLAMHQHLWTPVEEVQPTSALYQTEVTYQRDRVARESNRGQRWRYRSSSRLKFPLSLTVQDNGFSLSVCLDYDNGLYDAQTATQLLNDYCQILVALTKDLDRPLRELDVLSPSMRELLIDQQCEREQVPKYASALTRIMGQCDSQPHDLAISTFDGPSVTFGELGQRVTQLAKALRGYGVSEGDIVAIHIERSIEAVVSMLATHAAGAAFLPLDVNSPADRRIYMLEDARVQLILADGSEDLDTDIRKVRVDQELEGSFNNSAVELPSEPTPHNGLAYVIYTSGSTGKPKGVCIEHGSLANHITQTEKLIELSKEDRSLQFASLAFDSSMEEVFVALAVGASLWLRTDEMVSSAREFFKQLAEKKLTVLTLTTAFWHQLVHSQFDWPESVRMVLVGGERVDPGLHARFREVVSEEVRFINSYGPTEATVACTCYCDREGDHDSTVLPIGRPMGGASHFVLNEDLVPVPMGVEGQLYVGGAGLARGYLYREELTAERFIPHPFRDTGRLYATGDLVRHTKKGNLVYVDRIDHQVKVQGFRVELGEIETCLRGHQAVEEAVVVPMHLSDGGGTRIVAFVQVPEEGLVDSNDLREFVGDALPAFMVPRRVEVLSSLPQTPAGKVDRQTLAARVNELPSELPKQNSNVVVDDPLQEKLLSIWSEMLKEQISDPRADFFMIGGDSLLAVRLFTEIERELQMQCNPHEFFKEPTVEALARQLKSDDETDFKAPLLPFSEEPTNVRPLFFAPTVSGQAVDYVHLGEALKGVAPMYGLQMRGLRDGEEIHDDLRDAAKFYIELMREVQPKGPYSLAGYSAAGTVCLAIAEELHEQGESTDLMLMLDAVPPGIDIASPFSSPRRLWRLGRTTIDRILELFEGEDFFRNLVNRGKPAVQRLWAKVWPSAKEPDVHVGDLFNRSGLSELTEEESLRMQAHLDTTMEFEPRVRPVDVVLIRSAHDPFEGPFEFDLGWSQATQGNVKIEAISLRHNDFLGKDYVETLAEILKPHLDARS